MKGSLVTLAFLVTAVVAKELPSFIPICNQTSLDFNKCLLQATATLQPRISKGIKEINSPPFEPLEIPMVKLEQGTGAVSYKATISRIKLYGLSNYKFREFKANLGKESTFSGVCDLPKIQLFADYDISGKILLLPIQGNGDFRANITNCKATFEAKGPVIKKKDGEYLNIKDTQLHLEIGGAMVNFDNLFNGDPILGKTTNDFLNGNAKDILNEVKPAIEAVAGMLVNDILSKIFRSATVDQFFPK